MSKQINLSSLSKELQAKIKEEMAKTYKYGQFKTEELRVGDVLLDDNDVVDEAFAAIDSGYLEKTSDKALRIVLKSRINNQKRDISLFEEDIEVLKKFLKNNF